MPGRNGFCFFLNMKKPLITWCILILFSCNQIQNRRANSKDSTRPTVIRPGPRIDSSSSNFINTNQITPEQIVSFAETLIGIPYKYASTDPNQGFDCSGFITYVFNHFHIDVPRSSVQFTNVPHEVPLTDAKPGDLILFTGTDSTVRVVGHMGIIVSHNNDEILFIHSSSGKAWGVTITPLNDYYMGRFVKLVRVFPQNDPDGKNA